jgi:hypothetical protein
MGCVHVLWIAKRTASVGVDLSRVDPVSMDQRKRKHMRCDGRGKPPHPVSMVRQPHASRQVSVCGRDDPWLHIGWSGAHCSPNIDLSDTPPGGFSVVARLIPGE